MDSNDKKALINRSQFVLDIIRHSEVSDKKTIVDLLRQSWPIVSSSVDNLIKHNAVYVEDDGNSKKRYKVCPSFAVCLGISIGATETKIVFTDFSFCPIDIQKIARSELRYKVLFERICKAMGNESNSEEALCFPTADNYIDIHDRCSFALEAILDFFEENSDLTLIAFGLALPGIINKNTGVVQFCPNMTFLEGLSADSILRTDIIDRLKQQNISFLISHDTLAATVYEKEFLYIKNQYELKDKENIVVIYLGFGLGCSYIINNKLVLGASGSPGELGHVYYPYEDLSVSDKEEEDNHQFFFFEADHSSREMGEKTKSFSNNMVCACGKSKCLENLIRIKVFNSYSITEFKAKTTASLLKNFHESNPYRYKVLKHLIGQIFNMTVNLLNPDLIILSGRILNGIPQLKKEMLSLLNANTLKASSRYCTIISGSERPDSVAIGASVMAYYKLFSNNNDLYSIDISWQ